MFKILKKILLLTLIAILAIQVPFIYRRYKIGHLSQAVARINSERTNREHTGFKEYKGVLHVHTALGGHSTGGFDELIAAASANELDFAVMTEHYSDQYDTSALTLNGKIGKTLFIGGNEVDANDGGRYLLIPGSAEASSFAKMDSKAFLEKIHSEGRIAINNYPDRKRSDNADQDGIEVYSLHINAKKANPFPAVFDVIWSFAAYPELTYATYFRRNDDYLKRYDAVAASKKQILTAGSDAHSNKGYYLIADDEGNKHFGFKIDDYATVFRLVRMHVLLESGTPLTRESMIDALRKGNAFVGFDALGDTGGFSFSADNGPEKRIMGDEIALANGVKLAASAPNMARFVLFKDGQKMQEFSGGSEFNVNISERGVYRVEAYLDQLGSPFDQAPWIMSNPIYIR